MTKDDGCLSGRRILITGGASGIGLATARLFLDQGATVAILDRTALAVKEAAKAIKCIGVIADVTDEEQVRLGVDQAVAGLGGLDGLVNCAGTFVGGTLEDGNVEGWRRELEVNLTGPFLVTRAALPHLRTTASATIVNVASGIGLRPAPGQGGYAASKAGLLAWTKVLAQELGPAIRVNATCPGPTDTPLMRSSLGELTMADLGKGRALERSGEPEEQAQAILFLTGPQSSFVTGITVPVDGGRVYY